MVIFYEVQYMRRVWWVMFLVVGIAAMMWWGFIQQIIFGEPWGTNPAPDWMMWLLLLIFGLVFPLAFYWMRLIVEVLDDSVSIRYIPLTRINILLSDIQDVEAIIYKPLQDYGGWGIRRRSNRKAYNVSGNRGVEITLHDGRIVMIGSQKAEEMALAIRSQLPR